MMLEENFPAVRFSVLNAAMAAGNMSKGANDQAASIEETSASIEEMSTAISQSNASAKVTNDIAQQAAKCAIEGGEAARAGAQGQGFAVVATEVRKLAERSQTAASEIVRVTDQSVDVVCHTGELLSKMVPDINNTANLVQEISASCDEQAGGAGQISGTMHQLEQVTQKTASTSDVVTQTADDLRLQADNLQEVVGFFKLKAGSDDDEQGNVNSSPEATQNTDQLVNTNKKAVKSPQTEKPFSSYRLFQENNW